MARIKCDPDCCTPDRPGFTLVEIMVVLAIAGILAAMIAAGSMQVIGQQRVSNTETLVKKVAIALQRQYGYVVETASNPQKEAIPPQIHDTWYNPGPSPSSPPIPYSWGLLDMAGGNEERARVIWTKLRLKQEFPMNFAEALYPLIPPVPIGAPATKNPVQRTDPVSGKPVPYFFYNMPPIRSYALALVSVAPTGSNGGALPSLIQVDAAGYPQTTFKYLINLALNLPPAQQQSPDPSQSSVCLLLSLTQSRKGFALTPDDLGTGAVQPLPPVNWPGLAPPTNPISLPGLQQIVDAWGNPIVLYRFPAGNPAVDQTNPAGSGSSPNSLGTTQTRFPDPLDPKGLLLDPSWNNAANYSTFQGVWAFEMLCHAIHKGSGANYQPWSPYMVPVVTSAGKNGQFGFVIPSPIAPVVPGTSVPTYLCPDLMTQIPSPPPIPYVAGSDEWANDNISSYRLRLGARGD